jgi:glutaredoxin
MTTPVTIYTKPFCVYCTRAKALLETRSIPFTEIVCDTEDKVNEMKALSKRSTFPQVWVGPVHIGGSDELIDYHNKGFLARAVQQAASVNQ